MGRSGSIMHKSMECDPILSICPPAILLLLSTKKAEYKSMTLMETKQWEHANFIMVQLLALKSVIF